ncbi:MULTISPECIES: acetamidase/formamidase family protein [unclassified Parafrankia]|uniref:acetamidase/formamidase family protein n=1 Tax=Parafrankia TaxID=2994362 RepID=UPI0002E4D0AB|nr:MULTISPECIES: acetamidase/formamidase family protein [unclassified Parafrankia]TCJ34354.1 acetamidase [Parafrankia sp. BMG5.11]SQD95715.1 Acetamidase/Formamidase [Parafrankia sp. Ea1.12]
MSVLQCGSGEVPGEHYLPSSPKTVTWGRLPSAATDPVLEVAAGATVTIDTVSHEGLMEDQGRDPVAFWAEHAVAADSVLLDAIDIARDVSHYRGLDGPHVVTGPVRVDGARPGDILKVEFLELRPRVPYGLVSSRHGRGALPGELPVGPDGVLADRYSQFCEVDVAAGRAVMRYGEGRQISFPVAPFMGLTGLTPAGEKALNTTPPGAFGGNLDVRDLVAGSTLYLPVQIPGAGFYTGDPHFAQGHGEVSLTALEASLRTTVRLTPLPAAAALPFGAGSGGPFGETPEHWIAIGLHNDLDEAMRLAVREALRVLRQVRDVPVMVAYSYLSAAADFVVSQVVDDVKGVHCLIRKRDFPAW